MKLMQDTLKKLSLIVLTTLIAIGGLLLSPNAAMAANYTVKMGSDGGLLVFEPAKLSVKAGDTVEWIVNKSAPHNVVFDGAAKSISHSQLEMSPGSKFELKIPADLAAGDYSFYCEPHRGAGMVGTLSVS
jgi:plastocyanin